MKGNPKILIAEDDHEDRIILTDAFSVIGKHYHLDFVENGADLISILESIQISEQLPQLIILDIQMPKMGGVETLRRLKKEDRYKSIPVAIFSTSANETEIKECMQLGAVLYEVKPASFNSSVKAARHFYDLCV